MRVSRTVLGGALGETPEVYSLHDRQEIQQTNAWHDGAGAEYVLHCERLDNPPSR
jgi:hypothetical protein